MSHSLQDPLLVKTKDAIETKLPEPLKEPVERIVIAGMKLLYSPETHDSLIAPIYAKIKERGFQPADIANGMVNLLSTLYKASHGAMQVEAAYPAGVILLCYVLDDLEQTQGLQLTKELLPQIGSVMVKQFAKAFGKKQDEAQPGAHNPASAPAPPPQAGMVQQGAA